MITQLAISREQRYKQEVERELAAFENREREFEARDRKERAERLGLDLEAWTWTA